MDYDEVFQLAHLGARVIHPRAVEMARQFQVPLYVRSTFEESPGTSVGSARQMVDIWAHRQPERSVTSITQLHGLVQIHFEGPPTGASKDWMTTLFETLGRAKVSVDLVNLFPDQGYFCISKLALDALENVMNELGLVYQVFVGRAKVSVIGSAIQGLPGVVGQVMKALSDADVEVLQSADSHSTISLLVHESTTESAVLALHHQFGLDRP
jgi:aspartate kinase